MNEPIQQVLILILLLLSGVFAALAVLPVARAWDRTDEQDMRLTLAKRSSLIRKLSGKKLVAWLCAALGAALVLQMITDFHPRTGGHLIGSEALYEWALRAQALATQLDTIVIIVLFLLLATPLRKTRMVLFILLPVLVPIARIAANFLYDAYALRYLGSWFVYRLYYPGAGQEELARRVAPGATHLPIADASFGFLYISLVFILLAIVAWKWLLWWADKPQE